MAIHRVTAVWSGMPGAPGYTNFYFSPFTGGGDVQAELDQVRRFFHALAPIIPTQVTIRVQGSVEVVDEASGQLTGYLEGEPPPGVIGTGTGGSYVGPSGAVINWLTNTVRAGRRVRGRTFIVPLRVQAFDNDGTLTSSALADLRLAADILQEADFEQQLVVWSRPGADGPGIIAPVVGARIPDMAAVLRSRRD